MQKRKLGKEAQGHKVVTEKADSGNTYEVYWKPGSHGTQLSLTVTM